MTLRHRHTLLDEEPVGVNPETNNETPFLQNETASSSSGLAMRHQAAPQILHHVSNTSHKQVAPYDSLESIRLIVLDHKSQWGSPIYRIDYTNDTALNALVTIIKADTHAYLDKTKAHVLKPTYESTILSDRSICSGAGLERVQELFTMRTKFEEATLEEIALSYKGPFGIPRHLFCIVADTEPNLESTVVGNTLEEVDRIAMEEVREEMSKVEYDTAKLPVKSLMIDYYSELISKNYIKKFDWWKLEHDEHGVYWGIWGPEGAPKRFSYL
ncbi:hypothetical protein K458DRAFT_389362 [Lentithecium fluviatile CBS 122367]|uniref:Uncharacterized protein n=1 Tax=Lentithecium fluviatile CBS 122367 TaxID=1168545 RepID=A0A6G1J1R7_9PLEO|nr:hypothetical protein K458DRAFT_389362 [Lentithecium fluviatile CBS 122367]